MLHDRTKLSSKINKWS